MGYGQRWGGAWPHVVSLSEEVGSLPSLADPSPQVVTGPALGTRNCPFQGSTQSPRHKWKANMHFI